MDDTKLVSPGKATPRFNLFEFFRETRKELLKVTWPSRKDTIAITIRIVMMALIAGLFFFLIDSLLGYLVSHLLGMKE